MSEAERDLCILEHIIRYCGQIDETVRRFGNDVWRYGAHGNAGRAHEDQRVRLREGGRRPVFQ